MTLVLTTVDVHRVVVVEAEAVEAVEAAVEAEAEAVAVAVVVAVEGVVAVEAEAVEAEVVVAVVAVLVAVLVARAAQQLLGAQEVCQIGESPNQTSCRGLWMSHWRIKLPPGGECPLKSTATIGSEERCRTETTQWSLPLPTSVGELPGWLIWALAGAL